MKQQIEYNLQKSICQYLRLQYPNVLFYSDTVAQIKLSIPQAVRNKAIQKEEFKMPDLVILQPIGGYSGLLIELKKESPLLKNGKLSNEKHIQGQFKSINDLKSKGYFACFAWSFEMAKEIIDNYLNLK
jgi:hypothetical protein